MTISNERKDIIQRLLDTAYADKDATATVRVPQDLLDMMEQAAEHRGVKPAAFHRWAIAEAIKRVYMEGQDA